MKYIVLDETTVYSNITQQVTFYLRMLPPTAKSSSCLMPPETEKSAVGFSRCKWSWREYALFRSLFSGWCQNSWKFLVSYTFQRLTTFQMAMRLVSITFQCLTTFHRGIRPTFLCTFHVQYFSLVYFTFPCPEGTEGSLPGLPCGSKGVKARSAENCDKNVFLSS